MHEVCFGWSFNLGDVRWRGSEILPNESGLYILWDCNHQCPVHAHRYARAQYVGKGYLRNRLQSHLGKAHVSDSWKVTCAEMPNRQAKYVEQLFLDHFWFPWNLKDVGEGWGTHYLEVPLKDHWFPHWC